MTSTTSTSELPVAHAVITDHELSRLRERVGKVVTISERPYLTEVTEDAASNWAYATGDFNALYHDQEVAEHNIWGVPVAPPCMLYAFSRLSIGYRGGLPGIHSMFGGSHLKWHRPLRVGQKIGSLSRFEALDELRSRFAGRMFKQVSTTEFSDEDGQIGTITGWGMRLERVAARSRGTLPNEPHTTFSDVELETIAAAYASERALDFADRPFSTVRVGDSVGPLTRGPYTATTAIAFEQAWGGLFVRTHGFWFERLERHPALGLLNRQGVPEPPEAVHWSTELAQSVGVPDAYDYGPERIAWMAVLLSNWAGSNAFLEELYCEVRGFNVFGDVTYLSGSVRETLPETRSVVLDLVAKNQRGKTTVIGWGRVRLPA